MNLAAQQELFTSWMRDHIAIVHHVVQSFGHGDDRNDLMQEILIALWRAAPAFRGDSKPSTFIYRVSHNAALLWHRSERKHERRVAVASEIDWMIQPNLGRARSDSEARLEALYSALRKLAPVDRSLVLLSLDGVSYRDIAEVHGLSESNVGARLTRARQTLTELLNPKNDHVS